MKQFATMTLCVIMALAAATLNAKEKKKKAPLADLTLTGTIVKVEKNKKAPYALTLEDGSTVAIPANATKKAKIDLSAYVDKKVTVKAKGTEAKKGEKTIIKVRVVESVEEAVEEGGDKPAEE